MKKRLPRKFGYVYVLEVGDRVKIGRTCNPDQRIRAITSQGGLQPSNKFISPLHFGFDQTELAVHSHFSKVRLVGEWFRCNFDQAVSAVLSTIGDGAPPTQAELDVLIQQEREKEREIGDGLVRLFKEAHTRNAPAASGAVERSDSELLELLEIRDEGDRLAADSFSGVIEALGHDGADMESAVRNQVESALQLVAERMDQDRHTGLVLLHFYVHHLLLASMALMSKIVTPKN